MLTVVVPENNIGGSSLNWNFQCLFFPDRKMFLLHSYNSSCDNAASHPDLDSSPSEEDLESEKESSDSVIEVSINH